MNTDKRVKKERKHWDKLAPRYDRYIEKHWKIYPSLLDKIAEDIETGSTVLDVATGTGSVALRVAQRASRIHAIDISGPVIEEAKKKVDEKGIKNIEFSVEDAYSLPFNDGMFDIVVCENALHNMIEPAKALSEIRRVLKPGGRLIATVAGIGESRRFRFMMTIFKFFTAFPVFHKLNLGELASMIAKSGLATMKKDIMKHPKDVFPVIYIVAERSNSELNT
ncbi:methyltransferase domain-containing protein [bacterium]|nr:methyltransferase domain-containing protein [bacterium]